MIDNTLNVIRATLNILRKDPKKNKEQIKRLEELLSRD